MTDFIGLHNATLAAKSTRKRNTLQHKTAHTQIAISIDDYAINVHNSFFVRDMDTYR